MGGSRNAVVFSSCFVIIATVTIKCFDPDAGDALAVLLAQPHQSPAVRPQLSLTQYHQPGKAIQLPHVQHVRVGHGFVLDQAFTRSVLSENALDERKIKYHAFLLCKLDQDLQRFTSLTSQRMTFGCIRVCEICKALPRLKQCIKVV